MVDANDIEIGSDYISSLDIDSSETEMVNFTIPTNISAGNYYIIGLADADSTVTEKNESNNRAYRKVIVYIPTPDLRVTSQLPSPTTVSPGGQVSLETRVVNYGTGASTSTDVSYYFSTNNSLSSNDVYLGQATVSGLSKSTSETFTKNINIPLSATTGNYYIIAYVDSSLSVDEIYESNNARSTPIAINIPRPDYRVVNTLLSESVVIPGDTITISGAVKNFGDKDGGSSVLKYYFSDNSTLDVNTDLLIGSDNVSPLDIDSSSFEEIDLIIPFTGVTAGKKYIFYVCDANDNVTERYENNNRAARFFTLSIPKPDLRVATKDLTPTTVAPGEDLDLTALIKNFGNGNSQSSKVKYYLSTNYSYSTNDIYLGESSVSSLAVGADDQVNETVTIPANTTDGTRYIIYYADKDDDIDELYEGNNVTYKAFTVHTPEPDLVVQAIDLDQSGYYQNDNMSIDVTVKNQGDWDANASKVEFYLSSNSSLSSSDFLIGTGNISGLNVGNSDVHTGSFTIPTTVAPGKWYIIAKCDSDDDITEANENNNLRSKLFDVYPNKPDLKPISISISPNGNALVSGQSVNLYATIKNVGSSASIFTYSDYFLSDDTIYSSSDTYLDYDNLPALNSGDSYNIVDNFFLPSGVTGNKYILVVADVYDNRVDESNESNNTIYIPVTIGTAKMDAEDKTVADDRRNRSDFDLKVFPNPFVDEVLVNWKSEGVTQISILDTQGKTVFQESTNMQRTSINLSALRAGAYMIKVENAGIIKYQRVIKK